MEKSEIALFLSKFNEIFKEANAVYHEAAKKLRLSDSEYMILYVVETEDSSVSQSELCSYLCLSKQTVNSAIKSLEKRGWIELYNKDSNKKTKHLRFTQKYCDEMSDKIKSTVQCELDAAKLLTRQERENIISGERKYIEALKREMNRLKGADTTDEKD